VKSQQLLSISEYAHRTLKTKIFPMTASKPPTRDVDIDAVLPPDGKGKAPSGKEAENASDTARIIAHWMDEFIRIPGTNVRIGLDPIIGLFPGVGDFLASSIGVVTLMEGVRQGVPVSALIRMGTNILINDAVGTIPGVGDVFSAWFKSNSRNLKLINQWKGGNQAAVKRGSRIFMVVFISVWLGLMVLWAIVWITLATMIWQLVSKLFGG
jgi:hypothetical protein